ncbi:MAG: enoyl-CoA hydratase-related protein [Burkholderiaceae bacterium]
MIQTQQTGNVVEICIARPDKKNALSHAMYHDLAEAIRAADADAGCSAVILYGAGGIFSAGADINDFLKKRDGGDSPAVTFLRQLSIAQCPLIAAVEGYAIGIGATMLQHFDFVYSTSATQFRMPFTALGLCPEGGSSILLERMVGARKAMEWLLECRPFNGDEALRAGFLTALVDAGQALEMARKTAFNLGQMPAGSVRRSKQLLKRGGSAALDLAFDHEVKVFNACVNSEDAQNTFNRFLA